MSAKESVARRLEEIKVILEVEGLTEAKLEIVKYTGLWNKISYLIWLEQRVGQEIKAGSEPGAARGMSLMAMIIYLYEL